MFQRPFSFKGRITRTEFGLTVLIYFGAYFILLLATSFIPGDLGNFLYLLPGVTLLWFQIAQGCKRCHDLGHSGAFQLIPFYALWMLFQDSIKGVNEFGLNPKGIGNEVEFSFDKVL